MKTKVLLLIAMGAVQGVLYAQSGNVGIGTTAPSSKLTVNGNASVGSGYTGTAAPANGAIIQGNVGIGTTTPGTSLQVVGGIAGGTTFGATGALPANTMYVEMAGDVSLPVPAANGQLLFVKNVTGNNVNLNRGAAAELYDAFSATNVASIVMTPLSHKLFIGYVQGGNNGWIGQLNTDNVTNWKTSGNTTTNSGNNFVGTSDNASLSFRTNNVQRMYVDSASGNVGIGTSAPTNTLDVNGTARIRNIPQAANTAVMRALYADANGVINFAPPPGFGELRFNSISLASGATGTLYSGVPNNTAWKIYLRVTDACTNMGVAEFYLNVHSLNNHYSIEPLLGNLSSSDQAPTFSQSNPQHVSVTWNGVVNCQDGGNSTGLNYTVNVVLNGGGTFDITVTNNGNVTRPYEVVLQRIF